MCVRSPGWNMPSSTSFLGKTIRSLKTAGKKMKIGTPMAKAAPTKRFEELFAVPLRNGLTRPKAVRGEGVRMVNMGEIFAHTRIGNIEMDRVLLSEKETSYLLEAGDLLFARQSLVLSGAGKCSLFLGAKEPVTFESHLIRSRLRSDTADSAFYFYFFSSPRGRQTMESIVEQVAAAGIRGSDLARLEVPHPPLAEQKAIAAVLGALDDKIELNRRMNTTLEAMARALFQSWFVDFDPVRAKLDGRQPTGLDPATAALFPNEFEDSELGHIPKGWQVMKVGEFIERLSVGQKYEQKTVSPAGKVPVLDQGKSGVIGFHNNEPGVIATLDKPVVVFANHTCYMRLITYSFSAIQNVLPFVGSGVDTFWAYYATEGRLSFSEYKGHWPDFVIQESVVPPRELTDAFGRLAKPLVAQIQNNEEESLTLATLRDTLLPKLLSAEVRVSTSACST